MFILAETFLDYFNRKGYLFDFTKQNESYILVVSKPDKYSSSKSCGIIHRFIFKSNNILEYKTYYNTLEGVNKLKLFGLNVNVHRHELQRPVDFMDTTLSVIFHKHEKEEFTKEYLIDYALDNLSFFRYYEDLIFSKFSFRPTTEKVINNVKECLEADYENFYI